MTGAWPFVVLIFGVCVVVRYKRLAEYEQRRRFQQWLRMKAIFPDKVVGVIRWNKQSLKFEQWGGDAWVELPTEKMTRRG